MFERFVYALVFIIELFHVPNSLRGHPKFKQIVVSRQHHEEVHSLAKLLSDSSVGRQL